MRTSHTARALSVSALVSLSLVPAATLHAYTGNPTDTAIGFVFEDLNGNGIRDFGEPGVRGVSVSNGLDVVRTDNRGLYRIPVDEETVIFITKPAGYDVPLNDVNLPQFYYIHYPNGTPPVANWLFDVIEPTGPLPQLVNFPLYEAERDTNFRALAFADPQAGSFSQFLDPDRPDDFGNRQLSDLRDEFIQGLVGTDAKFLMVAGDVINDDLDLYPRYNRIVSTLGIPVWNTPGNHDMNFKSPDDRYSTQTYISIFGPPDYSFDYGDVHFIAMDDVAYRGNSDPFGEGDGEIENWSEGLPEGGSNVKGFFTEQQLEWLRNDLRHVPREKLVVLYVHISLKTLAISGQGTIGAANINVENLDELMEVLNLHPNVYSFSGHDTSNLWTLALGVEEGRAPNLAPVIHKKIAEVRTSLGGPKDDRGVRISHTQDGNPNGYYFFDFEGDRVETRYQAGYTQVNTPSTTASELDDFQMRISVGVNVDRQAINDLDVACPTPDDEPANGARNGVIVNVFDSNAFHRVNLSLDGEAFVPMAQMIREADVTTLPDGLERPRGTAWCRDPFMTRYSARINQFLEDISADLESEEVSRTRISSPQPSSTIWEAELPVDLAPGTHTLRIIRIDEHGNRAEGYKVFEVCSPDDDDGVVPFRDCYNLGLDG